MSAFDAPVAGPAVSRILIVGGGVSGLALANGLAEAGIHVEVVERNPRTSGSAIGLWSFAANALEKLGLKDELLATGSVSEKLDNFDARGNLFNSVDYSVIPISEGQPAQVMIGRPALAAMLDRVARKRGAQIRHHVTFDTVRETDKGVEVTFTDGTSGSYDLLIGADGVFSTVRRQVLGITREPRRAETGSWQITVPNHELGIKNPTLWSGPNGSFMLYPSGLNTCAAGLSDVLEERPETPELEKARICELLAAFDIPQARYVQDMVEKGQITMEFRRVHWLLVQPPWFRGRVVLVGDAVHASPPNLGGGASMALEDAAVLTDALCRHGNIPDALDNYMRRRWARIENVYNQSFRAKVMAGVNPQKYFSVNSPILREVLGSLRHAP